LRSADATNACYHTAQDDLAVVDFDKLDQQTVTATYGTLPPFTFTATAQ